MARKKEVNFFKEAFLVAIGLAAAWTLLNPIPLVNPELLPDALPWIGNIDEAFAVAFLTGLTTRYFKFNPVKLISEVVKDV